MHDDPSPPRRFQTTRWSLVARSRGEGDPARLALEDLCRAYWFPLYAWCRRYGLNAADAADAVQGFFARVLEKNLFTAADAQRGKLRTFLLTALHRHVRDERDKERAERRGGGRVVSLDLAGAEGWYVDTAAESDSLERVFERQWALTVLDRAVRRLEKQAEARGKAGEFAALRPFLTREGEAAEFRLLAEPLGMSEGAFKVAVHRLRARFAEALRAEVADTQDEGADIDEEIACLRRALLP